MKRFIVALVVGSAAGSHAARAQAPVVPVAPAAPAASAAPVPWANKFFLPDIATNPTQVPPQVILHDFGSVAHGTLCVHKFTITNVYNEPMQVVDVRKSCTCLDYVPIAQAIAPNQTAEFTVTMNSGKFVGYNAQTFYVTFGPKFVSTAVVRLQATSLADVVLTPGSVAFGTVALGAKAAQAVEVEYKGKGNKWAITGVVPTAAPLDVRVQETSRGRLFSGAKYRVDVALKPNAPAGTINEPVTLKTNDPNAPEIQLAVTGTVQAPLELAPSTVRLDPVAVGQTTVQRVIVRAGKPFKIVAVEGDGDGVTVEPPPAGVPLPVNVLTVKFEPRGVGPVAKTLRVRTDLDGGVTAVLPVEAEGIK